MSVYVKALPWFGVTASIGVGLAAGRSPDAVLLLSGVVLALAAAWAVLEAPEFAFVVALVGLALVPFNGLPFHSLVDPGLVILGAIAVGSLSGVVWVGRRPGVGLVEAGAGLLFIGLVLSFVAGHEPALQLGICAATWGIPFVAGRAAGRVSSRLVLRGLAIAGVASLPFAVVEATTGNVFFQLFAYGTNPTAGIGIPFERLGHVRAQGAFGQPIPYAMFLTVGAAAAAATWVLRPEGPSAKWRQHLWLFGAAALVAVMASTLARTGWLMLFVVVAVIGVVNFRAILKRRNVAVLVLGLVSVLILFSVPTTRDLVLGTNPSPSQRAELVRSANYRTELRRVALRPGYLDPLGDSSRQVGPGGAVSIDNAYIVIGWTWGYLPLLGFAVMLVGMLANAFRMRTDLGALVIHGLGVALLVAISSVAMFGQQQVLIWLVLGASSGVALKSQPRNSASARLGSPAIVACAV